MSDLPTNGNHNQVSDIEFTSNLLSASPGMTEIVKKKDVNNDKHSAKSL